MEAVVLNYTNIALVSIAGGLLVGLLTFVIIRKKEVSTENGPVELESNPPENQ